MLLLILLVLCTTKSTLFAETYTWVDENGTMNFTDNLSSIPQKYRKKALKREEIEYGSPSIQSAASRTKEENSVNVQPEKQIKAPSSQSKVEPRGVCGGKGCDEWASEFRARNSEISSLEQQIRHSEELLKNPTGLNKEQIYRLPQEIVSLITQRNDAIKRYNEFNDTANRAGVPPDYRK